MKTRFAPSPTGPLHLGHAYAALFAHDLARSRGGVFLLRIEDIDRQRSKPEWEAEIYNDLLWLGLHWALPVLRQSERLDTYRSSLETLWSMGLLYPCTCSRRDIDAAVSAPQEGAGPVTGPDGLIYPGTCRHRHNRTGPLPSDAALRLDIARAADLIGDVSFQEKECAPLHGHVRRPAGLLARTIGDVVLARRDFGTSYHLSVVVDDAAQGITHVTRGEDLFDATYIHVVLQKLLGLPTPIYHHHRLIRDDNGKRLAKRDDARALSKFRAEGATPADIRRMVGL